jgi:hypothetical protein
MLPPSSLTIGKIPNRVTTPRTELPGARLEVETLTGPGGTPLGMSATVEQLGEYFNSSAGIGPNHSNSLHKAYRYLTRAEIDANGSFGEAFEDLDYATCCIQTRVWVEKYQPDPAVPMVLNQVLVAVWDSTAYQQPEKWVHVDGSFREGDKTPAKFVPIESVEAKYGYVRRDTNPATIVDWQVGELSIWSLNGTDQFATAKQASGPFPAFTGAEDAYWKPAAAPVPPPTFANKADLEKGRLKEGQEPPAAQGIKYIPGIGYVLNDGLDFELEYGVDPDFKNKRVDPKTGKLEDAPGWNTYSAFCRRNTRYRSQFSLYYAYYANSSDSSYLAPWTASAGATTDESTSPNATSSQIVIVVSIQVTDLYRLRIVPVPNAVGAGFGLLFNPVLNQLALNDQPLVETARTANRRVNPATGSLVTDAAYTTITFSGVQSGLQYVSNKVAIQYGIYLINGSFSGQIWYKDPTTGTAAASFYSTAPTVGTTDAIVLRASFLNTDLPSVHIGVPFGASNPVSTAPAPGGTSYTDIQARAAQLGRVAPTGTTTVTLTAESATDYGTIASGTFTVDATNCVVGKCVRFSVGAGASAPAFSNAPSGQPYKYRPENIYVNGVAFSYSLLVCVDKIEVVIAED